MALNQESAISTGILPDSDIIKLAERGMIEPFERSLVREVEVSCPGIPDPQIRKVISYGPSSYGYDIRLSPKDFRIFRHIPGTVIDPKNFNPKNLESVELKSDRNGEFFIIPAHSYGLGVSLERFNLPNDVTTIAIGKSTYARCALIANVTPFEAGWQGHPTLEFSNGSGADVRIYANEGCLQILFLRGEPCRTSYSDRAGKYQSQGHEVVLARV